jgi:chromosome segregation ATPase
MADDKENQLDRSLVLSNKERLVVESDHLKGGYSNEVDSSSSIANAGSDTIRVVLRVRPLTPAERERSQRTCLELDTEHNSVSIGTSADLRRFTYDYVAAPEVDQARMFYLVGRPLVESCLDGYNGTVFAYGQTGSGKTYTMQGELSSDPDPDAVDGRGLMPRLFEYIFAQIARRERERNTTRYLVRCSYLEVYNEVVTDLLDPFSTNLAIREDFRNGVSVDGLSEETVPNAEDCLRVLERGLANRHIGSTSMNRESSRSHSVFIMIIESETTNEAQVTTRRRSRLNLVDLAGSERQKLARTSGQTLREAGNINKSLSALGNVINALVDIANGKERHIHYRDSKLTFLLKDSLGGNTKTTMIATVSPSEQNFAETLSTLKFAQRAKYIKNKAIVNEHLSGNNIVALQAEVSRLRHILTVAGISPDMDVSEADRSAAERPLTDFACEKLHLQRISELERLLCEALDRTRHYQDEKRVLEQQSQALSAACRKRDKALQQSKMILRLRDAALERARSGRATDAESQELLKEIEILREQVEHHPEVMHYAAENLRLQQQVRMLEALVPQGRDESILDRTERFVEQLRVALHACVEDKSTLQKRLHELLHAELEPLDQAEKTHNRFIALELYKWREKERFEQQLEEARSECRQALVRAEHAERELESLRSKTTELERAYEERRTTCVELETAIATLQVQQDERTGSEQKIQILSDELREAREHCQSLETDAAALEEECDRLRSQRAEDQAQLRVLENEKEALEQQRIQLQQQLDQLDKDGQRIRKEMQERAQTMAAAHSAELTTLESRLGTLRTELESQLERNGMLQDQLDQIQSEANYHRDRYAESQQESARMREQICELTAKLDQVSAAMEALHERQCQQAASHDEQLQHALQKAADAELQLDTLRETLTKTQSEHEHLRKELENAQRQLTESSACEQSLRETLKAAQHEGHVQQQERAKLARRLADLEHERDECTERIATLERELEQGRIRAEEASAEATARIGELIQELERKHSALTRAQLAQNESVARAELERKQLIQEHAEQVKTRDRELAQLQVEVARLRQETAMLQASVAQYRSEHDDLDRLRQQEQQFKTLALDWEQQRRQRAKDMEALKQRLEAAESEARMRYDAQADAQREISCLRQQMAAYQQQAELAERGRCQLENRLVQLERDKQRLTTEYRQSSDALRQAESQLAALQSSHNQTALALAQEKESLGRLRTEMEQLQHEYERLEEENTKLGGHHNLRQRIHHHVRVKEENANLRRERDRLAAELESCRLRLAEFEQHSSAGR